LQVIRDWSARSLSRRIEQLTRRKGAPSPAVIGMEAPLGQGARGMRGTVVSVGASAGVALGLSAAELERRLIEIGFVEGASVEILHQGMIGGDPIAVKLDDMRVALRRREADAIMVRLQGGALRKARA
jgi:ferrous iron transport protein A